MKVCNLIMRASIFWARHNRILNPLYWLSTTLLLWYLGWTIMLGLWLVFISIEVSIWIFWMENTMLTMLISTYKSKKEALTIAMIKVCLILLIALNIYLIFNL